MEGLVSGKSKIRLAREFTLELVSIRGDNRSIQTVGGAQP